MIQAQADIASVLKKHAFELHPVIPFNKATDKIASLNLSKTNTSFTGEIYNNIEAFSTYIDQQRQ